VRERVFVGGYAGRVSELPISSPYRSTPDAPVTDEVRNQLSAQLNSAYTDGKIDGDDFRARLDRLFAAQRLGELVPVVQGLPPLQTYSDPAIVASTGGRPGELAQPRDARKLALVTGGAVIGAVILIVILLAILL
jgi:hypothetical protein